MALDDSPMPSVPARPTDTNKYACGRVLVIAGSTGMSGAGALATRAAMRSGAGLVTWAVPAELRTLAEALALENTVLALPGAEGETGAPGVSALEYLVEASREVDAVVLGPGLPVAGETGELLRLLVPEIHAPLVLDAGGLTAIGTDYRIFAKRQAGTVVTPHEGEMGRLINQPADFVHADRAGVSGKYARAAGVVVVLKGAGTIIADAKQHAINPSGNPGMASGGMGDVLAGVIAALLAQGMETYDAARLGVYLHGVAGDLAAAAVGERGIIASDLVERLPAAFTRHIHGK